MQAIVLPGDELESTRLPSRSSQKLKLGPGLRVIKSAVTPTTAGILHTDLKKNAIWIENNFGRYIPRANDTVIATVHHSSAEAFHCSITPHTAFAQLPHLAFEGATKKTRPQLASGSLVYAKIVQASKHTEPELSCLDASAGGGSNKNDGLGELKGGMVFGVSLGFARRLLMARQAEDAGLVALEELGRKVPFEIAVGRNGSIWINAGDVKTVLLVGRALQEVDGKGLGIEEQQKLVKRMIRTM